MTDQQKHIGGWILRGIAAVIMLQTLFFKFSGAAESIYIFSRLGMEPWGRIGTGVLEFIASVLILLPKTKVFGALMGLGLMAGAIFFHLTNLGIVVQNDQGKLFGMALLVFACCLILTVGNRRQLLSLIKK
ncbi:DoxX family protein [Pedobacter sp. PACM 27299]|uniref:DoxX family protein n=1 Tax=Pedobacter sp. PACM 27299 TaxID=1727164 RepID=UPI00070568F8|nr:DoxX family protein [Pedobacter sp. PACM 27299]ALL06933.1 DoxX family protein [Pedobacter sp. PACM 27299]